MSAGPFVITNYESTELTGSIMPCKVQPETLLLFAGGVANSGSASAITLPLRVNVSGGNQEYGVKPRKVTITFTDPGAIPAGYTGDDLVIPVMTQAAYDAYLVGVSGTYLGSPIQIISRSPERAR